ncbi:MFS transporter [Ruminococcaceae bacterium OttesenSCG-928-I18]|nr:MFS transporter [Ruminococcaceae bacterium OttesenSCG-928-I18]
MAKYKKMLLVAGIVLVSCTMRSPLTGVGSLIHQIQSDLGLSSSIAGMITTIPLVAFAVASPFMGRLADRFGAGRMMVCGLAILAGGLLMRSYLGMPGFFAGAALMGIGITFANVLLPSIIKAKFPTQVGLLTAVYTIGVALGSGVASGVSIPISQVLTSGWRGALSIWIWPVCLALVIWLSQWGLSTSSLSASEGKGRSLFRSPVAWSVTAYMGLQSLLFYSLVAWLPSILQFKGLTAETSGYYASLFQWMGIPGSLIVSLLAGKLRHQKWLSLTISCIYLTGLSCFLFGQSQLILVLGVVFCGFGAGSFLSLAMCLFGLRTTSAVQTARISGAAQCVGYALASISPILLGGMFDRFSSWTLPLIFLLAMALTQLVAGLHAGADRTI